MFYCLTEHQIRQLYYRRLKPNKVLIFENQLVFTYTGEDVLEHSDNQYPTPDQFSKLQECACQGLGDAVYEAVAAVLGTEANKLTGLDQ